MTVNQKAGGATVATAVIVAGVAILLAPAPAPELPLLQFGATNGPGLEWIQSNTLSRPITWTVERSDVLPPVWTVQTTLSAWLTNSVRVRYRFPLNQDQQFYRVGAR